jgi:hypothetical protein
MPLKYFMETQIYFLLMKMSKQRDYSAIANNYIDK